LKTVAKPVGPIVGTAIGTKTRKKRILSPEARKRIADAQKKRWAAVRKAAKKSRQAVCGPPTPASAL
jgi:hypothetical protein